MKTHSMTIRLSQQQALKIAALAAAAGITKTEAVVALVDGQQLTPKNAADEPSATPQNLAEIEGAIAGLQASFSTLIDAVAGRLETIENTLGDRLGGLQEIRRQQTQLLELLADQNRTSPQVVPGVPAESVPPPKSRLWSEYIGDDPAQPVAPPAQRVDAVPPQAVSPAEPVTPSFSEFLKGYPAPAMAAALPKKMTEHRQFVAKKYQEKFGVWPDSVPPLDF